jgi:hypothetical protein
MKKAFTLALFTAVSLILVAQISAHTADDPMVVPLISDGGTQESQDQVGVVKIWNNADSLVVKFELDPNAVVQYHDDDGNLIEELSGWLLGPTHVHVAESMEDIPQKNGNPPPGKFDHKGDPDSDYEKEYVIGNTWEAGTELCIAAHAEIFIPDDPTTDIDEYREETGWGDGGGDFPGSNWAKYITYVIQ